MRPDPDARCALAVITFLRSRVIRLTHRSLRSARDAAAAASAASDAAAAPPSSASSVNVLYAVMALLPELGRAELACLRAELASRDAALAAAER
jgi:hypothetical protein